MAPEELKNNLVEEKKVPENSSEKIENKEISREEFSSFLDNEEYTFKNETTQEINKSNSVGLDQPTFQKIKNETGVEQDLNAVNEEVAKHIREARQLIKENEALQNDTKKEVSLEKKSSLEKVKEKGELFMRRMRQGVMVLGVLMAAHYTEIHTNQVEKDNVNGKEMYRHPDKETNHILNYIGGIDSLSDEERIGFIKRGIRENFEDQMTLTAKDFESINSEEELVKLYIDLSLKTGISYTEEEAREEINTAIPKKYEYNDTLYKVLWETEKECGSPNMRWTEGQERNLLKTPKGEGVANFNQITNTINIHSLTVLDEATKEWTHAKQFHDNYIGSLIKGAESGVRIAKDVVKTKSFVQSQLKEYDTKNSLEYEAHEIIEPYLKAKFKSIKSENTYSRLTKF